MATKFNIFLKNSYATLFLVIVVLSCVFLLFFVNLLTKDKIAENNSSAEQTAVLSMLGVEELPSFVWQEAGMNASIVKFASISIKNEYFYLVNLNASGYAGPIVLSALYDIQGRFLKGTIVNHTETDGIGSKIAEEGYFDKFYGLGVEEAIPTEKGMLKVDTVSGATVSFIAVAKALESGSNFIKELGAVNE